MINIQKTIWLLFLFCMGASDFTVTILVMVVCPKHVHTLSVLLFFSTVLRW